MFEKPVVLKSNSKEDTLAIGQSVASMVDPSEGSKIVTMTGFKGRGKSTLMSGIINAFTDVGVISTRHERFTRQMDNGCYIVAYDTYRDRRDPLLDVPEQSPYLLIIEHPQFLDLDDFGLKADYDISVVKDRDFDFNFPRTITVSSLQTSGGQQFTERDFVQKTKPFHAVPVVA